MAGNMVYAAGNTVGESVIWDTHEQRLLWVDIVKKRIHALTPENGKHEEWAAPDFVTSIGLRRDGGAIVGLTRQLCLWDFDDVFRPLANMEPELPGNRLNEGVVGPDGAFWVGTMQNNIKADGSPDEITAATGRLYRCTAAGDVIALSEERFGITNTLAWSDDGGLFTADTLKNEIYHYHYDPRTGRLSDKRTILSEFDRGLPDGSTMDSEGYLWNCRVVGGACVVRLAPDGRIDQIIDLPCSWPTSCTFGGKDLDTLYVTSARFTMDAEHLAAHPEEGGLFAIQPGVRGLPAHRFA